MIRFMLIAVSAYWIGFLLPARMRRETSGSVIGASLIVVQVVRPVSEYPLDPISLFRFVQSFIEIAHLALQFFGSKCLISHTAASHLSGGKAPRQFIQDWQLSIAGASELHVGQ
jgi:hypothetical protein